MSESRTTAQQRLQLPSSQATPERWRQVLGFEGLYEVSDMGRVRSLARRVKNAAGSESLLKERIMKASPLSKGHMHLALRKGGKSHWRLVHVLVLEAFVSPRPDGLHACHCNGISSDNRLVNLRWDTPKANMRDAMIHGTGNQGFRNPRARLTREQIVAVREAKGSTAEVAAAYGVCRETVRRIKKGLRWGWA